MTASVAKPDTVPHAVPSAKVLASNTAWNLFGFAAPMLIGLFAIPYLIDGLGKDRFGLLSIIWMGVGYFSLFDMGFGRALTKLVAERLGSGRDADLGSVIWTALWVMLGLGLLGAMLVMALSEPLMTNLLNVPSAIQDEGLGSFRLLATCLPIIVATSALIGILEAHQRFALITAVRIPLGVATFLGPVVSLQFSDSLVGATALLVAARVVAFILYFMAAAHVCLALKSPEKPSWLHIGPLVRFGGWLTVSTVVGPIMLYSDRFLIGSLLTMTAVAYYTTPYEVLSRAQVLPQSLFGVLFPAFAAAFAGNPQRLRMLYDRASEVLLLVMLPMMALTFLFAPELLHLWLGAEFSKEATPVARWLALGWLHVMIARTNSTVLQATGRPDLLAKAHLAEVLPFLGVLWWTTTHYGIAGAALAWCLRGVVDALALAMLVGVAVPSLAQRAWTGLWALPFMWATFGGLSLLEGLAAKLLVAGVMAAISAWLLVKPLRSLISARVPS